MGCCRDPLAARTPEAATHIQRITRLGSALNVWRDMEYKAPTLSRDCKGRSNLSALPA